MGKERRKRSGVKPAGSRDDLGGDAPLREVAEAAPVAESWRRDWLILGLILLAGLLLRGAYLVEIIHEPDFSHPALDPQFNDYWARAMVSGDWTPPAGYPDPMIRTTPHGRPPGYPYFLAAVYWLSGSSYLAPRVAQMALGLVNAVLMFLLGRAIFGRVPGLIAAAFMATYWIFVHFEGELTYPVVAVCITLLMMLALLRWSRKPSAWLALAAGMLLGAFALFRPNGVLFGPVMVAWFAWVLRRRFADGHAKALIRAWLAASALATVGTLAVIAPALIRNYVVAHDFVFLSSYGGVNLWAGNNENADCVTPKIPNLKEIAGFEDWTCFHYPTIVRGVGRMLGKPDIKFSEASRYFYDQGVDFITHHPLKTLVLLFKKTLIFWGPVETTNDKVLHYAKLNSPILHWLPGFPMVLGLFVMGMIVYLRTPNRPDTAMGVLLLLFIFSYYASVVPYFVAGRYRVPIIPYALLIGAYGVARIAEFAKARDYKRAGLWAGAAVGVYVVGSLPFVTYKPDLAIWHHQRATAFEQQGDLDKAIDEVHEELKINPSYPDAYNFLGTLLAKQGKHDEAIEAYRKAIELKPAHDVALNNLGYELYKKGQTDEALKSYTEALRANPQFGLAHNNLGNLLLERGQADEARRHFEEALRLDPSDKFADYNLGNALRALGKSREAVAHYERAMTFDRANADIPNNLGLAYSDLGESEKAVQCYEQALLLDAGYANAHNNLGFEYAKLGDAAKAIEQYNEAIRIDPKFALPHNNLGRLYAQQKRYDDAVHEFARALQADPNDPNAEFNLGEVFAEQGKFEDAIPHYQRALKANPRNPDIPNGLANALARTGRFQEAERNYELALSVDPRYLNAYCNLGVILRRTGRFEEACKRFRQALEIDPSNALAREGLERATKSDSGA